MTDLEITRLCAVSIGLRPSQAMQVPLPCWNGQKLHGQRITVMYAPLHDDAQTMALVKKFGLDIEQNSMDKRWFAFPSHAARLAGRPEGYEGPSGSSIELNRAVCTCVAQMQKAKGAA